MLEQVEMEDTTVGDNSNAKPLENASKKEDEEEVEVVSWMTIIQVAFTRHLN